MEIYQIDPSVREMWRTYPVRIPGGSQCPRCDVETVLVQSMEGGFVTRNCAHCNDSTPLPKDVFFSLNLWVACPECSRRMTPNELPDRNYGYVCRKCDVGIRLSDLLPRWEDLQH